MPIIKSAKKRVKQAVVRRQRNYNVRVAVRKSIRTVNDAVKDGDKTGAEKALSSAYKLIDTAVKRNILHKNTASRRKSGLAKSIASMGEKKKTEAPKKKAVKKAAPKKAAAKKAEPKKEEEAKAE